MLLTKPFQDALPIIEAIEEAGHQAYYVGGCVRDFLLNCQIGDIDITTSAKPDVIQAIFDDVIPVGIEHGTVIVRHQDVSYEVTTFRVEGEYSDKRHPDTVEFINQIDKDLERRDFTINALAMDKTGEIIDLFNGREDLENRIIRTVGNGNERFKEDSLRILRAVRFTSQLGFWIDEHTKQAIINVKPEIEGLAIERITKELHKLFAGNYVAKGLEYLVDLHITAHIPILKQFKDIQTLQHITRPLSSLSEVICFIHQREPNIQIRDIVAEWKCSNKVLKNAMHLNEAIRYYKSNGLDNWLVYVLPPELYKGFSQLIAVLLSEKVDLEALTTMHDNLTIRSKKDLAINGNDILEMYPNHKKGPWIHSVLIDMEKQVVLGNVFNTKTMLKEWIKWNPPEIN
ncbi:CCA tRNA nucleotidyltransferase [Ornithinibacillus xuwenensis]|uniref:CCA-adding enzyme n=1 Tax=Ornithinibacillus xuwenensis TaxID=3144668 RepID=A0ABU9XD85_9BACI